jgi:ribonuclease D
MPNGDDSSPRLEGAVLARFDALRRWRTAKAKARGVDPDIVFSNDILTQIALQSPTQADDLLALPAIGPWKAETYGPEIVGIVTKKR